MSTLVVCFSPGSAPESYVGRLVSGEKWDKVVVVSNAAVPEGLSKSPCDPIVVDDNSPAPELVDSLCSGLKGRIADVEVCLNMVCGGGKLHMALLASLLKLGLGIRLYVVTKEGLVQI